MKANVTTIREIERPQREEYDLDAIMVSVGLHIDDVQYTAIGTAHEVLVSKLERVIRVACKKALLDPKVAPAVKHSCDGIFDEAVRGVASDVSRALLYGRRDEAASLLRTSALDVFSTEIEMRESRIN